MKRSLSWLCFIVMTVGIASFLPGQQIREQNLVAFKARLHAASNQEAHALVQDAFKQRDMDALLICLEAQASYFFDEFDQNREQSFKVRLVLVMLRKESLWEPLPRDVVPRGGMAMAKASLAELVVAVAGEQLKDKTITAGMTQKVQDRYQLADRLEHSILNAADSSTGKAP